MRRALFLMVLLPAPVLHAQERWTLAPEFALAATRVANLDGQPGDELLLVGKAGEVRVHRFHAESGASEALGELVLPDPGHTLLQLVDMLGDERLELVCMDSRGARAYTLGDDGIFTGSVALASRARCRMRTGRPMFSSIVSDVNGDGHPDLLVPTREAVQLWLASPSAGEGAGITLRRAATISVRVTHDESSDVDTLEEELVSSFTVPGLATQDVNGDGREDLLVSDGLVRAFHMQAEDGTYPLEADVSVNLSIFKDTTPDSGVRPGSILSASGDTQYTTRDLSGDGIPDYVISHRRKVWVFHGTLEGPQFIEPAVILRVADDVTALVVTSLDDDDASDLLLLKVEVPGIAALVVGLFSEWDVTVRAVGYKNEKGLFGRTPEWKRDLALRLPAILDLVRNPMEMLAGFQKVENKFRVPTRGDFDSDGRDDLALVSEDGKLLEVWHGREGASDEWDVDPERGLRDLLFENETTVWDIERILAGLTDLASSRLSSLTAGREPDGRQELRDEALWLLAGVGAADLDGAGGAELLLFYEQRSAPGRLVIEITRAPE
jgi:hypothetical protein